MSRSTPSSNSQEDIQALRGLITQLAEQCGLDLGNRGEVRRFLDNESVTCHRESINPQISQELRNMLVLLYRLEASSSEDLGVEGLRRLWRQHRETLARFDVSGASQVSYSR